MGNFTCGLASTFGFSSVLIPLMALRTSRFEMPGIRVIDALHSTPLSSLDKSFQRYGLSVCGSSLIEETVHCL